MRYSCTDATNNVIDKRSGIDTLLHYLFNLIPLANYIFYFLVSRDIK